MNAKDEPDKGFGRDNRMEKLQPQPDHPIRAVELYAWLGIDELGSGEVGVKQVWAPGAKIPLVAAKRYKMEVPAIVDAMRMQAEAHGKKIRLCRFVFAEVVSETPAGNDAL